MTARQVECVEQSVVAPASKCTKGLHFVISSAADVCPAACKEGVGPACRQEVAQLCRAARRNNIATYEALIGGKDSLGLNW